jgi:hypothetical protein
MVAGISVGLGKILKRVSKFQMNTGNLYKTIKLADTSGTKRGNIWKIKLIHLKQTV